MTRRTHGSSRVGRYFVPPQYPQGRRPASCDWLTVVYGPCSRKQRQPVPWYTALLPLAST